MKINWKRMKCQLLHGGEWRRYVRYVEGEKKRILKCIECDEEWHWQARRPELVPPIEMCQRPQDFYTGHESEFRDTLREVERLRKAGIL